MKKILCLLAVLPILATGCGGGRTDKVVLDSNGGEYYVTKPTTDISEKVKPTEAVTDADGSTKPPKFKDSTVDTEVAVDDKEMPSDADNSGENGGDTDTPSEGENTDTSAEDIYRYHLEGIVLEVGKDSLLINEVDLRRISLKCDSTQISDIKVGDEVTVKYDGELAESYPQQGTAHTVEVTKKAEKKYEMKRFVYRDLYFSVMLPEGWADRVIDYPQEGDFTDWGIRFQPSGAKGSLDVSWHSAFAIREAFDKRRMTLNGNSIIEYSKSGVWKFIEYVDQSYVMSNNFTTDYDKYKDDIEIIKRTLEFI